MASLINPNNTQPFSLNSLKPKNTTTPLSMQSQPAQNYISSLLKQSVPNTIAAPKKNVSSTPVVPNNLSATSPTTIKPTTPTIQNQPMVSGTSSTNPVPKETPITQPQSNPVQTAPMAENPRDAYVKYLSQYLSPSQQESDSRMNLAKIQNEEQARQTELRRQQEATIDQSGGLRSGAIEASNQIGVRGNRELADIALRKNAEANLLSALTGNRTAQLEGLKPLQIGNDLIDPSTGKIIYSKPVENKGFELGKDQVRYELDPKTGQYKQVAQGIQSSTDTKDTSNELLSPTEALSLGVPYGTTRGQAFGITPQKTLTEGESKAKQYGANAQLANDALNSSTYSVGNIELPLPNMLKSGDRQLFEQSARQFVNAILRRESGATITDSEFLNKYKELIPQAGDSAQVIAQKKLARDLAVKQTIEAGQAFNNQSSGTQWTAQDQIKLQNAGFTPQEIEEYKKASGFSNVGSDTNKASNKEIVAGYDITSYATNPKHGANVQSIYSSIPSVSDAYIAKKAPNSPIKASDVIASANKYGVDPKLVLAIMVEDSSLGTAGKAVRTKNPGNVGNDDTGALRTYSSWQEGIDAVAKNLAWRKINKNIA